jgi:hypothetical protein
MDRAYLKAPGGFLWWYLDLLDDAGNGLVLIWSFGLPFLPGYAHASRRGRAEFAGNRPSLNVAVYQGGKLDCYLLQEYAVSAVQWEPERGRWKFGETRISTRLEHKRRIVEVEVDCPVPASSKRLNGTVLLEGASPELGPNATTHDFPEHEWIPLALPARGSANLRCGETRYDIDGRAYHDCNAGQVPLHELGIGYWLWGRAAFDGFERVYYALWPEREAGFAGGNHDDLAALKCFGLEFRDDGRVECLDELRIELGEQKRSLGGMAWWPQFELYRPEESVPWLVVAQASTVDSGPFYMRHITRNRHEGRIQAPGFNELIRPSRVDLNRHRMLVDMRVHQICDEESRERRNNSMWLPLFSGPKKGRVARLGQHAAGLILEKTVDFLR